MGKTLILNSSNIVENTNNSVFRYTFPSGGFTFKDDIIGLQSIAMYFSTFNISTTYNNKFFQYEWVDGTIWDVNLPNAYFTLADINAFFQSVMYSNGHYLVNATGNLVYLMELVVNQPQYAFQLNSFLIDTAIATSNSWVLPSSPTWVIPTLPILPYLIVPSNNNFGLLIGFAPGQYPQGVIDTTAPTFTPPNQTQTPAFTTAQATLSSFAPQITPYSSILVFCSLVNNRAVIPSQLIYSFTPNDIQFGNIQIYQPQAEIGWNKIENGTYTTFTIEFRDQLGNPIAFQDPNTLITLYTKNRDDFNIV